MRCRACNHNLSDRAASRKFLNWREIKNSEERYLGLCDPCIVGTGLTFEEDVRASNEEFEDDEEVDLVEFRDDQHYQSVS